MKTQFIIAAVLSAGLLQAQPLKRYDFKSIRVTYAFESSGMGSTTTGTRTLKADDYGNKESKEEVSTFTMKAFGKTTTEEKHTLDLLNGDTGYSINLLSREGTRMNLSELNKMVQPAGLAMAGDPEQYRGRDGMRKFVEDNNGTWEGEVVFMNRNCWVFTLMGVKMWMYKGLVLKSESTAYGMNISETATSIDENVSFPASAFEVPAGITISSQSAFSGPGDLMNGTDEGDETVAGPAPGLPYERFKSATTSLNIPGYTFFLTDNSDNLYLTTYVKTETDQVVIMMENEPRFYEMAEGGDGVEVIDAYAFNGHDAVYLRITNEEDGTPADARMFLYHMPEFHSVLYIITGIPMSREKIEQLVLKIKFV